MGASEAIPRGRLRDIQSGYRTRPHDATPRGVQTPDMHGKAALRVVREKNPDAQGPKPDSRGIGELASRTGCTFGSIRRKRRSRKAFRVVRGAGRVADGNLRLRVEPSETKVRETRGNIAAPRPEKTSRAFGRGKRELPAERQEASKGDGRRENRLPSGREAFERRPRQRGLSRGDSSRSKGETVPFGARPMKRGRRKTGTLVEPNRCRTDGAPFGANRGNPVHKALQAAPDLLLPKIPTAPSWFRGEIPRTQGGKGRRHREAHVEEHAPKR